MRSKFASDFETKIKPLLAELLLLLLLTEVLELEAVMPPAPVGLPVLVDWSGASPCAHAENAPMLPRHVAARIQRVRIIVSRKQRGRAGCATVAGL